LPKVSGRLVSELVYGIQASQSVVLTKVGRVLEENISIKKTEERLSRQLGLRYLGSIVQHNLLKEGSSRIHKDTFLKFDPSDLRKKYANPGFLSPFLSTMKNTLYNIFTTVYPYKVSLLYMTSRNIFYSTQFEIIHYCQ